MSDIVTRLVKPIVDALEHAATEIPKGLSHGHHRVAAHLHEVADAVEATDRRLMTRGEPGTRHTISLDEGPGRGTPGGGHEDGLDAGLEETLTAREMMPRCDRSRMDDQDHYNMQIDDGVYEHGLDRQAHDRLRLTPAEQLDRAQRQEVADVRNRITNRAGSIQAKVLSEADARAYLDNDRSHYGGRFDPSSVRGFTARGTDVRDLTTPAALRDGLALDDGYPPGHPGSWTPVPEGAPHAYQLRWNQPAESPISPSFGATHGHEPDADQMARLGGVRHRRMGDPPFLGTGYTGGGVPEYYADAAPFGPRAEMWKVRADGTEELVGVYTGRLKRWVRL